MSETTTAHATDLEADPEAETEKRVAKKRRWIEDVANDLDLHKRQRTGPSHTDFTRELTAEAAQQEAAVLVAHRRAVLEKHVADLHDDAGSDTEMAEAEEEEEFGEPTSKQAEFLKSMLLDDDFEDEDDRIEIEVEEVAKRDSADTSIPQPDVPGRRILRARRSVKPLVDPVVDPSESPLLMNAKQRPKALKGRDKGTRERVATAYGLLAETYRKKVGAQFKIEKTKVPGKPLTRQTEQLREAFANTDAAQVAQTDFDFFLFPGFQGDRKVNKPEDKRETHVGGLQGPHTVAHIALASAMRNKKAELTGSTVAASNAKRFAHIDEMIATDQIPSPEEVRSMLMEEEPAQFANADPAAPAFAATASKDRQKRIRSYSNRYTELYNQLISILGFVSDTSNTKGSDDERAVALEAAYDRAEELMNLHPYQSYGWRADDEVVGGHEIRGKGEGAKRKRLFEGQEEDTQLAGLAGLVDGLDAERMAANAERYREFLIGRIFLLLDGREGLGKQEVDDIYNQLIRYKMAQVA